MKIAFYLGALNRGGAETLLADIFSRGDRLPFDAVCIYRNEGTMSDVFHRTSVPMLRLRRKRSWMLYGLRLRRLVLREKVDIVHAQTAFNAAIAILFLAFTRVKVVTTFHGFGFVNANPLYKRLVFRHSRRLIFVSNNERDEFLKHGSYGVEDRCVVVYNGIDFSKFGYAKPPTSDLSAVNVCMVGSFGEGRNHLFVCKCLNALKQKGVDFHFTFIGAARDSERAIYDNCVNYCHQHGLDGNVTFYGLSNDVPHLLTEMDAFVYATRHDSFGIAVIEAIATGLPTFVNDNVVMQELSNNGQFATLYKTDDIDSFVSHFEDFLSQRQDYFERAQQSAAHVRTRYDIDRHINTLFEHYKSVI